MPGGHADAESGQVTDVAFAAARGLGYLAIALAIGGALFLFVAWLPGLAQVAGGQREWLGVSTAFARHLRHLLLGAVVLGVLASATSIVLEAATAAGVSFWAALDRESVDSVSSTRPVEAWTLRIVVWLALGIVLAAALRPRRVPTLRRTALGATGAVVGPAPSRVQLLVFGALAIGLALTAPMAGHTGEHDPRALLICTDTMHVLCMSAWLGGLVMLLIVLGLAARRLPGPDGKRLMAAVVGRFSMLARFAVVILLLTGIAQSIALVGSLSALRDTDYGLLVLAKILLLGAAHRARRLQPALGAAAPPAARRGRRRAGQRGHDPAAVGGARGGLRARGHRGHLGARRDGAGQPRRRLDDEATTTTRGREAHEICAPFARGSGRRARAGARHSIRDAHAGSELQDGRAVHVAQSGDQLGLRVLGEVRVLRLLHG